MAQRHEIEAYLGGNWPAEETERIVEQIMATGSDDEAAWMRVIAQHEQGEDLSGEILAAASRDYDRAGEVMDAARDALYEAIRQAVAGGMTRYRAAQVTGLSQPMVARIVRT